MQLGVVAGLVALLSSGERAAAAELDVDGPRSCSRAADLRMRVERALGRSLQELGDVSCRVHVVRDGGSYAARVELTSAGQSRTLRSFSGKTCPKLMDTLELALVLAVGAEGGPGSNDAPAQLSSAALASGRTTLASLARRGRSDTSGSMSSGVARQSDASPLAKEAPIAKAPLAFAVPETGSSSAERARAPTSARSDAPSTWRASASAANADVSAIEPEPESLSEDRALWHAFGGVVLDAGALPGPALGAQLGGSFGSGIELRALGTYLLPRQASYAARDGGAGPHGVDLALATGAVLGCAQQLARLGHVELGACAGGELGVLWSDGGDLTRSRSTETLWSAMRAEVGARWEVAPSWLGLDARLGLSVPLSRPRFGAEALEGPSDVYRPTAIGGRLSLAATFALDGAR